MKYNKYEVTVTEDYLTSDFNEDKSYLDWASEHIKDFKPSYQVKKGFKTFKDALDYVYSLNTSESVTINDICCGEVYQSTNIINKCNCCGDIKYDKIMNNSHHINKDKDWQLAEI